MQRPNFANYEVNDIIKGYQPEDFFTIVRGKTSDQTGRSYDEILHASMQVPDTLAEQGITLTDALSINGRPLWWGAQVAETFNQALAGTAFEHPHRLVSKTSTPSPFVLDSNHYPAEKDKAAATANPAPLPLVANAVYKRLSETQGYVTTSACLTGTSEQLNRCLNVSNATVPVLPTVTRAGSSLLDVAISASAQQASPKTRMEIVNTNGEPEPDILITHKSHYNNYSVVPGQHSVSDQLIFVVDIQIGPNVAPGRYGVRLTNPGVDKQQPLPAALIVTK